MVCLSTRDRSYNCDSLLMRVYHYLIECLLKYFTYSLIQNRTPFQKDHLVLTSFYWNRSIFLLVNYVSVS